jgi:hypothetical protein
MKTNILKTVKKYTKIALLLCAPIAMTNCGEGTEVFPEIDPLAGFLDMSGFAEQTDTIFNMDDFEIGISFIPEVSGQINAVVAQLPLPNPALRVTIWDVDTETVIKTVTVNVPTANTPFTVEISPLVLEKNKEYLVSMNSNDWYRRRRVDGTPVTYPIAVGDFLITNYVWNAGTEQTFPEETAMAYYGGDISFLYQEIAE